MALPEELFKLVLDELRKNNDKIDLFRNEFTDKFSDMGNKIGSIVVKINELDIHVKDAKEDVEHLEHTVKGNGTPGLKTKLELIETHHTNLAEDFDELKETVKNYNLEDKKESSAIKVAIISGAGSGFIALILQIVNHFIK